MGGHSGNDHVLRSGKGDQKGITGALALPNALLKECGAQNPPVVGEDFSASGIAKRWRRAVELRRQSLERPGSTR